MKGTMIVCFSFSTKNNTVQNLQIFKKGKKEQP